jgi:hypothetical protein
VVLRWSLLPKETGFCFRRVRKIAKSDCQLRHISVYLSVCPSAWKNSGSLGQILTKLDILVFLENLLPPEGIPTLT